MRRKGIFLTIVTLTLLSAGWAWAQDGAAPTDAPKEAVTEAPATDDSGTAFVAMDPADSENREELPAFPFLYSAYAIIWVGLFLYLISLGRRQTALDQKIEELNALVANRSSGD